MKVTEVIEQEYENPLGIHVNEEKLVNISFGVILDDDIAENIINVVDEGKSRIKVFRQKQLILKEISFHPPIKISNYKSFRYVVRKIRLTKREGNVKVEEVNKNTSGTS